MNKENVIASLSDRETQLIQWVSKGYSRSEIAEKMSMSVHTYDAYRKNIRIKLQIKNQADWARILTQLD
ncbi:response regulator transcription factor [Ekhidna lutea]|uniref:response regulator transcription factor n=1 Tax=Ekhidna lutea TaxID=447679 RepID=UPI000B76BD38|nr:helix-turn-helix transcriptional regulator [Ekhidna lutea]